MHIESLLSFAIMYKVQFTGRFKRILPCVGEFRRLGLVKRHQFGSMYCTFGGYTHPFMEVLMIQVKSSLAANMVIQ